MIRGFLSLLRSTIILLFMVLFSLFASNNTGFVEVNLSPFGYLVEIRLFLLVLTSFVLGMVATMISAYLRRFLGFLSFSDFFYRRKVRILEKKIKEFKSNSVKIEDNKSEVENDERRG
ncbi:MAG: lipopolysaccharide assembly protein LapA domain-containing protein [Rickettsiales bacterium]|jgi:uncharacterized integral membrane protein|nr:lipopolysaccharide assembly protein LapA domain-containing protein [Rickettsiales bacterium]